MSRTTVDVAIAAAERPVLLQTAGELEAAERVWYSRSVLGIDTEFVRERTYRADLGLIQVSDGVTAWLWDPLSFDSGEAIQRLLHRRDTMKVLHSGSEDLEVLLELAQEEEDADGGCGGEDAGQSADGWPDGKGDGGHEGAFPVPGSVALRLRSRVIPSLERVLQPARPDADSCGVK